MIEVLVEFAKDGTSATLTLVPGSHQELEVAEKLLRFCSQGKIKIRPIHNNSDPDPMIEFAITPESF